ncbi:hypothetical protein E4U43_002537 [Claviceps pusilla]|uniref:Calcineurin-like phosphoesterase domain-containing protein n=1 Tax=Claviceps pusilla TaxID=123648 RepID=A0A9P7T393_9HYPO|nr:hypothetical protein E4U43_002537 [Claviceps pusilla]
MATPVRRTRIVCISDTHNCTVKLPKGDVLIHAGDLTNQGSFSEISRAVKWLEQADFEAKIVIAGNHDITLDHDFHAQHGHTFHNNNGNPHSSAECLDLLSSSPSITYLNHESATVRLSATGHPHTQFTVFGSPYSPRYGQWAFYYDEAAPAHQGDAPAPSTTIWDDIPPNTDIVVTHTPPRNHGDATTEQRPKGCEALRRALWCVQPRLAVCGHIHDGRGAHRIVWDTDPRSSVVGFAEKSVSVWTDPGAGNNKLSLVDLTARKGPSLAEHETCVVNAAILRSRHPHEGGKQFNKPIVVDVDLPAGVAG